MPPTPSTPWDHPTRLAHWLLALGVVLAWPLHHYGDLELNWHMWNGYALLGLVGFRVLWGFCGSETARFGQFVKPPGVILAYVRGHHRPGPGHNPLGALSVLALLGFVLFQVLSGLFANDDLFAEGPLAAQVSSDTQAPMTWLHSTLFYWLLGLVGLHLTAIAFYQWVKGQDLIRPMLWGRHRSPSAVESDSDRRTI